MRGPDERGFTMIELIVVICVIAVLMAIAIPSFLGVSGRASDRRAQSHVRIGLTAALSYRSDHDVFTDDTAKLTDEEPGLDWTNGGGDPYSVEAHAQDDMICLASETASGRRFVLVQVQHDRVAGTYYGTDVACPSSSADVDSWSTSGW